MHQSFGTIAAASLLLVLGCEGKDKSDQENLFLKGAINTAPTVVASAGSALTAASTAALGSGHYLGYGPGNIVFEIFELFAEEGTPNINADANIYQLLDTMGRWYDQSRAGCSSFAARNVTSTLLNETESFDCVENVNGHPFFSREAGSLKVGMLQYADIDDKGAFYGTYDTSSGDLLIDAAHFFDVGGNTNQIRLKVTGNALTHAFQLRVLKIASDLNVANGALYRIALVGTGISQGSGLYYAFQAISRDLCVRLTDFGICQGVDDQDFDALTAYSRYWCIEGSQTTVAGMQALGAAGLGLDVGSDTVAANCSGYAGDLATLWSTRFRDADLIGASTNVPDLR
jgi:hypothetical protein